MFTAKKHIDKLCKYLKIAKDELAEKSKDIHEHRPGDNLIMEAFNNFTSTYFDTLKDQWDEELHKFIT